MTTAHDSPDSAELSPPQDDLVTRKMLGPYELKRKLGQGGMGAVYLAIDTALKRQVALKILPREKAANPQLVKRFKAEAQNASQLTHDNIVSVYGAGEADGYLYIALEFIDGIDVHDLVERRGILPVKRSIDIIKQVSRALQHALDQGIVHRDIKPANLLIRRDGMVKLADMGLARAVDESMETGITRAGTTVGTVDYMSPEQARNSKAADVRSDMYSLGCTWYHMLTGAPPFAEGSLTNKLHAHAKQPPPDPRDKNAHVPEGVVAVMQRLLAKNPDDRYQTPAELIKDLEGALVNKDAVSRKILEAIEDESFRVKLDTDVGSESSDIHPPPLDDDSQTYPVEMDWTDSVAETQAHAGNSGHNVSPSPSSGDTSQPGHPTRPEEFNDPAPQGTSSPRSSKTTSPGTTNHPPHSASRRQLGAPELDESEPDTNDSAPRSGKTRPTNTATSRGATASPPNTRQAPAPSSPAVPNQSHKPAPPSSKGASPPVKFTHTAGAAKTSTAPGNPRTLPPPKRKGTDEPTEKGAPGTSNPIKVLVTCLAIGTGIGLLVFLAHLAQQAGNATAPAPINSPFEQDQGTLPPPPPPPQTATTDANSAASKDPLIEAPSQASEKGKSASGRPNSVAVSTPAKLIPDWIDAPLPAAQVPMFSVRKGPTIVVERQYGTLREALKAAGPTGARIVLFHDGPFDLTPTEIGPGLLMIEAAQGARPQIRFVSEGEHRKFPWLNVTGGTLALDGVNFVGDVGSVPLSDPWFWVRVTDGNLYVRRSTFTLNGRRSAPTTALKVAGLVGDPVTKQVTAPRFLLDQSVVRGEGLSCVQLESPSIDAVIRQSLIATGDAAAISMQTTDKPIPNGLRQLRCLHSTIGSSERAFSLSSTGTTNPVQTDIILIECLLAAPGQATKSVLLHLEDWPVTKPRAVDAPPYKNLHWKAMGSAVLGFRPLLKVHNDEAATVVDGTAWKKLFKETVPTTYSALNWPAEIPGGIAVAPLKTWSLKSLGTLALSFPVPNVTPGCPVSMLRVADLSEGGAAQVNQPQRPRPPVPFAVKSTQQVDLLKTDLGKLLGSQEWEDGTLFVASGSGQRASSPIRVDGHRWRIQFRQTEGPPLILAPHSGPRSGGDDAAFITVRGGQLDLESGTFNYDLKDSHSLTPWFLNVEGGGFSFKNCRILMPQAAAVRNRGIVRWVASDAPDKTAAPGNEFADYGQMTDSLLIGNGTLISADLAHRALLLENCAFIARQNLFEFQVGLQTGQAPSAFDAQNCTYLTGGTFFGIKSQTATGANPLPSRFALEDCIFAGLSLDPNSKTTPVLMNYMGAVDLKSQILWYEESCGYSPNLKAFYVSEPTSTGSSVPNQNFEVDWAQRWGGDSVRRPLLGSDGVLFEKPLTSNFLQLRPENLALHKTAKARTWSETGGPIGVNAAALEPPAAPSRSPGGKKGAGKALVPNGL